MSAKKQNKAIKAEREGKRWEGRQGERRQVGRVVVKVREKGEGVVGRERAREGWGKQEMGGMHTGIQTCVCVP